MFCSAKIFSQNDDYSGDLDTRDERNFAMITKVEKEHTLDGGWAGFRPTAFGLKIRR